MRLHRLALAVALLGALLLRAQDALSLEEKASAPSPIGPIRIVLLDGCFHATLQQAVARTRTTLPVTIDARYLVPTATGCSMDARTMRSGLTALAKAEEAAQQLAHRRHEPIPLTIFYIGTTFDGFPDSWRQSVERLARSAILIVPSGNLAEYQAADIWPSAAVKISQAFQGQRYGSGGKAVSVYLDFGGGVEVVIDGVHWGVGATSTAAMLFVSHLGNVLRRGVGTSRTPAEIQARIKAAFHEETIEEKDLEERLEAVLK
jgi:hypothetical protein